MMNRSPAAFMSVIKRAALALSLMFVSRTTYAGTYNGSQCISWDDFSTNNIAVVGTEIRATAGLNSGVVCPIIKTTSGPSITTGDQISSASVSVDFSHSQPNPASGSIGCTMNVYSIPDGSLTQQEAESHSNILWTQTLSASGPSNTTLQFGNAALTAVVGYWQNFAYTDIQCGAGQNSMSNGTAISSYSVNEAGNAQPTVIFPSSFCIPESQNAGQYTYGQTWAMESFDNGGEFAFDCEFPGNGYYSGNYVDVFVGPNLSADILLQTQTDDSIVYGGESPYFVPEFPTWGRTLMANGSGFVGVYSPSGGDSKILMYRLYN